MDNRDCKRIAPAAEPMPLAEIEKSIVKKFRRALWSKFTRAVRDFKLVAEGDKIAVALSGGKDSMVMAKLFQELQRHGRPVLNCGLLYGPRIRAPYP